MFVQLNLCRLFCRSVRETQIENFTFISIIVYTCVTVPRMFVDTLAIPVVNLPFFKTLKYPLGTDDRFVIFPFSFLFVIHIILLVTCGPLYSTSFPGSLSCLEVALYYGFWIVLKVDQ